MNDRIISILIISIVGLAFTLGGFYYHFKRMRLKKIGVATEGTIIYNNEGEDSPTVCFDLPDGKQMICEYDISIKVSKGRKVTVIYNPEKPSEFIIKTKYDTSLVGYVLLLIGAALVIYSLLVWLNVISIPSIDS